MININDLQRKNVYELEETFKGDNELSKQDTINGIVLQALSDQIKVHATGVFEGVGNKWGFLRFIELSFRYSVNDIYVTVEMIKKYKLREGHEVSVTVTTNPKSKYLQVLDILTINGIKAGESRKVIHYNDLPIIFPNKHVNIDRAHPSVINRIIDLISPIGYGQRGIIASSPKAGKTTILEHLARGFIGLKESEVIVLLVAERPEEFTYFSRKVPEATFICSSFDEAPIRHVKLTSLTIEYALRKIELGKNVVMLIDSLTRYVRAVNLIENSGGKVLTGGLDSSALNKIKQILGAARNLENYSSLTIIATMLINTGSKMDDIIFDESKGTANWDLILLSELSNKGFYPGIDITNTSTRRADLMLSKEAFKSREMFRRILMSSYKKEDMISKLLLQVKNSEHNDEILKQLVGS